MISHTQTIQFVGFCRRISVSDHFVGLALTGFISIWHFANSFLANVPIIYLLKTPENSSNVNEAIRAISNFFILFYGKTLHTKKKNTKSTTSIKSTKTQTSEQATFFPLDVFYAHKKCCFLFTYISFVRVKSFRKKNKIALTASFTLLLILTTLTLIVSFSLKCNKQKDWIPEY